MKELKEEIVKMLASVARFVSYFQWFKDNHGRERAKESVIMLTKLLN